jgi:hypothetical protein
MSVKRTIIIPAILALAAAGSILAGSTAHVAAASHAPSSHVVALSATPEVFYYG